MIPAAFLGSASSGDIYAADVGHTDAGAEIPLRIRTNPLAPAGASQECTFERLWLTLTWSADAVLMVTPVLDGEVLHFSSWEIRLVRPPNGRRQSKVFEQVMRRLHTGPLPYKYALRGTWFGLQIETAGSVGPGDLIIDQAVLDFMPLETAPEAVTS